ncbi:DUF4956 domain-containing protein [Pelagibacteraceae bacterium]|jgi:uncharacterized membrane protein YhiD involved in acid resistance|nr:DUF4956 domain-containing protein [Pelagibacteraceae bacterium]|tara:strand:+ start:136 stop:822 length:687 start_codon:yes stop_codon:yes gene_type:complete
MEKAQEFFISTEIYSPNQIVINLLFAFFLGLLISLVYKKTHKGLSYSQSFMVTNVFVTVIVCMVIMIIGNNLARAFALVGALSIIRFRTVVKDTKDTAFIFWSLASGMATGTGSYFLAIAGNILLSLIAYILYKSNFGSIVKSEFILQFRLDSGDSKISKNYIPILSKFTKAHTLLSSESSSDNKSIKVIFDIVMKEEADQNNLLSEISTIAGISEVVIIAAKTDVDY